MLKVFSSFASLAESSRAQYVLGGVRERHVSEPSFAAYAFTTWGWGLFASLCLIVSTPDEKEAMRRRLEHVAQTDGEEKATEEALRRFHSGAGTVSVGEVRLGLIHYERKSEGVMAERYGDP